MMRLQLSQEVLNEFLVRAKRFRGRGRRQTFQQTHRQAGLLLA